MADETIRDLRLEDATYRTRLTGKFARRTFYRAPDPREVRAFIPGVILAVHIKLGQRVQRGEPLLVLEAMKMKNDVLAPRDGTIKDLYVRPGQMVAKDLLLLEFE